MTRSEPNQRTYKVVALRLSSASLRPVYSSVLRLDGRGRAAGLIAAAQLQPALRPSRYQACAFGLNWESDLPLTPFPTRPVPLNDVEAAISVRLILGDIPQRACDQVSGRVRLSENGFRFRDLEHRVILDVVTASEVDQTRPGEGRPARIVRVYPRSGWNGRLPTSFFSTVAALLLAGYGAIPIHGTAVEQEGEATLICGSAGSGKSTTAARMLAQGARLISDDLSVLHPTQDGPPLLFAGRRTLRLFPETAELLGRSVAWQAAPVQTDRKLAVSPPQVPPDQPIQLRKVLLLGAPDGLVPQDERASRLFEQLFRPRLQALTPDHQERLAAISAAAPHLHIIGRPAL